MRSNVRHHLTAWLFTQLMRHVAGKRPPNFIVGDDGQGAAYLRRWYITPWRGWYQAVSAEQRSRWQRAVVWCTQHLLPNLYLHQFLADDDDRALHDHPSWAVSLILHGEYLEHTQRPDGLPVRQLHSAGSLRFLPTLHTHRIELLRQAVDIVTQDAACPYTVRVMPCWTLFLFGPKRRDWGFHCPNRGWVPWQQFTAAGKPGEVGKGCDA